MTVDDRLIRECEVVDVIDDTGGLRIKVRFVPEDNRTHTKELPYCYPLLPKHFHINPKVGEMVLVITSKLGSAKSKRWFIGPIISHPKMIGNDPFISASGDILKPIGNPDNIPEYKGTLPDRDDVAILGKKNTDIQLKDKEVCIRAGLKKINNDLYFNDEDLAYIQMKYNKYKDKHNNEYNSVINIVADKINLLSHKSTTQFKLTDRENLIKDGEIENIINKSHPLIYGDELVFFLKQLVELIRTHTHSFPLDPPTLTTPQSKILSTNLDEMLSKSVSIN